MPTMTTTSPASPAERAADDTHTHPDGTYPSWQPGRVAWFDAEKGFGFLNPDRGGYTVFCDYTAIDAPGYRTLRPGQRVVFTVRDTPRGPEAERVLTYAEPGTAAPAPRSRVAVASRFRGARCRRLRAAA